MDEPCGTGLHMKVWINGYGKFIDVFFYEY